MSQDPMDQDFGAPQKPARQGMSQTTKIVLGIVGVLLLLCCGAVIVGAIVVQRGVSQLEEGFENPEAAAEAAGEIVDYTLPPGFEEQGAMNIFGINMVLIANESSASVIMLMSFPQMFAGNEEQMQQQMEESFSENFGDGNVSFAFVESREVVINDQEVVVNVFEGTDEDGVVIRQATGIFEGDSGKPSMFMLVAPASQWDSVGMDDFIDSLN